MTLQTPANEATILPTLSQPLQDRYLHVKQSAMRASEKYPDMDSSVYTEYLNDYLATVREYNNQTIDSQGRPLDPRFVRAKLSEAENNLARQFDQKYPTFVAEGATPDDVKRAKQNERAVQRLYTEVHGEGLLVKGTKLFYDEEKGGAQWGKMAGMAGGLVIGGLMGKFLGANAGELGGGWLGTIATVLLAISGAAFGAQLVEKLSAPATPPAAPKAKTEPAPVKAKEPEVAADTPQLTEEQKKEFGKQAMNAVVTMDPTTRNAIGRAGVDVLTNPSLIGVASAATRFIPPKKPAPDSPAK